MALRRLSGGPGASNVEARPADAERAWSRPTTYEKATSSPGRRRRVEASSPALLDQKAPVLRSERRGLYRLLGAAAPRGLQEPPTPCGALPGTPRRLGSRRGSPRRRRRLRSSSATVGPPRLDHDWNAEHYAYGLAASASPCPRLSARRSSPVMKERASSPRPAGLRSSPGAGRPSAGRDGLNAHHRPPGWFSFVITWRGQLFGLSPLRPADVAAKRSPRRRELPSRYHRLPGAGRWGRAGRSRWFDNLGGGRWSRERGPFIGDLAERRQRRPPAATSACCRWRWPRSIRWLACWCAWKAGGSAPAATRTSIWISTSSACVFITRPRPPTAAALAWMVSTPRSWTWRIRPRAAAGEQPRSRTVVSALRVSWVGCRLAGLATTRWLTPAPHPGGGSTGWPRASLPAPPSRIPLPALRGESAQAGRPRPGRTSPARPPPAPWSVRHHPWT